MVWSPDLLLYQDEIRSVEGLGRSARNGFVDASRGGPEGTAKARTGNVHPYDKLTVEVSTDTLGGSCRSNPSHCF